MMGPTIAKKGYFDGLHNHLKNYFETKFPFLVILMGSTITKKGNSIPKCFFEEVI